MTPGCLADREHAARLPAATTAPSAARNTVEVMAGDPCDPRARLLRDPRCALAPRSVQTALEALVCASQWRAGMPARSIDTATSSPPVRSTR